MAAGTLVADETIHFREGGGTGYTDVTFDDTCIYIDPADSLTYGNDSYNGFRSGGARVALVAVKDMFSELPKTTGSYELEITSAALHVFRYNSGSSGMTMFVYPMLTDWLPDSAGTNENDCSGVYSENSSSTTWSSGNFSSADYDDGVVCTGPWVDAYNGECELDVTDVIQAIYDNEVNYGMMIDCDGSVIGRASEHTIDYRPSLEIAYEYVQTGYDLTVNSGTGDGTYAADQVVNIAADSPPANMEFDCWVGDTSGIDDVDDPTTTITMPAAATEITATYVSVYGLTVNSGSGDGTYAASTVVNISADAAPSGMFFDAWTGGIANVADVNDPTTTITMPASAAEVTATYTWVAAGLVSRYTFDADASDSTGSNDGTLTNGAAVATDGTRGKVVSLDGDDDYVALPSATMAAGRGEMTLCMWVKPDTWAASDCLYDEYAEGAYWQFTITNGGFFTRDSSTGTMGSRNNDIATPALTTGSWQHVAVTYSTSGGLKAVYRNAAQTASSSTSIDTLTSSRDGVGLGYACDGTQFDGMIDDVRLYSRVLNSTELALLAERPLYTLTVNSGSGDGEYVEDTNVNISADGAPAHMEFDCWIGNTANVDDVDDPTTSITMPSANATITATYTNILYTLTVSSGTGDGSYAYGTNVNISADAAASGYEFDEWTGYTAGIADVEDPTTTVTMPASSTTVTATYAEAGPTTTLIVNWGDSAGNNVYNFSDWDNVYLGPYTGYSSAGPDGIVGSSSRQYGTCGVNGSSESFSEGEQIVVTWYNDTGSSVTFTPLVSFDDPDHPDGGTSGTWYEMTQLELDAAETGTSTYTFTGGSAGTYSRVHACRNINNEALLLCDKIELVGEGGGGPTYYTLTVNSGSGDGDYTASTVVNISANAAASGYAFDDWIGNTSGIADVDDPTTTLTMPAANQTITATYNAAATYTLAVNSGSGDGSYAASTVVDIDANAAASGYTFDCWVGNTSGIANVNAASTTLTMPAANQTITATYEAVGSGPAISSTSGTITHGSSVTISGSGFGTKPYGTAPQKFDDFENGTDGAVLSTTGYWNVSSNNPTEDKPQFSDEQTRHSHSDLSAKFIEYGLQDMAYTPDLGFSGKKVYMDLWLRFQWASLTNQHQNKLFKIQSTVNDSGTSDPAAYPVMNFYCWRYNNGSTWSYIPFSNENGEIVQPNMSSPGDSPAWYHWQVEILNSDINTDNGEFRMWRNGNLEAEETDLLIRLTGDSNFKSVWLGRYLGNYEGDLSNTLYYDEVYLDDSWARVEIGNASTWSGCSHREIQVPTSWSSSSVTVDVNQGTFSDGVGAYLYVTDDDGNVNANGYAIDFAD
jgi:hypothetical protein